MTLIAYPFPIHEMGKLHLPDEGLDPADAERLIEFVRSITIPEGARDDSEAGT